MSGLPGRSTVGARRSVPVAPVLATAAGRLTVAAALVAGPTGAAPTPARVPGGLSPPGRLGSPAAVHPTT
ncbi:hypothetical protein, partial [Micromonospora sp. KC207]|uniref:hypothetical protein n=1 Tax=Micromonospora sp. KC207 TaxID=2530377 RepID=UPI001A9CC928